MRQLGGSILGGFCAALLIGAPASVADETGTGSGSVLRNGSIGFVLTDLYFGVYQNSDVSKDCPKGFNPGPREQYRTMFPSDGPTPTVTEARLKFEGETWVPTAQPDRFPFYEPQSKHAIGLDLDDETSPNDFLSPQGEAGVDNQLYRAIGCIEGFRRPLGVEYIYERKAIKDRAYNRLMIQLTGVDSLTEDPEVLVSVYRGIDRLLTDASGEKVVPGGSQRIDTRWGEKLVRHISGQIVDGLLTTEPIPDLIIPWMNLSVPTVEVVRDMRIEIKLSRTRAEGLIAGYFDVETMYFNLIRNDSTHHLSNGYISATSLYKKLRRVADAYPDPETGSNTAVSGALEAKFVQVYIVDPSDDGEEITVAESR